MKSLFLLFFLLFGSGLAFANQMILMGADFQWGAAFNSKFGAEICSSDSSGCRTILARNQTLRTSELAQRLAVHPELIANDRFVLKWGYYENTECCGLASRPWLSVSVQLLASQVKTGEINSVYFSDGTYYSSLECIPQNSIRKANGLGYEFIGSVKFIEDKPIAPKGYYGKPIGSIGLSCTEK